MHEAAATSQEKERIFHPLIITADEQTMTTLLPAWAHNLNEKFKTPFSCILFEVLKNATC